MIESILLNKDKYRKWGFTSKAVTLHAPFKTYGSNGENAAIMPLTVSVNEMDLNLNTILTFSNGDSVKMDNKGIWHRMQSNYGYSVAFYTQQHNCIHLLENNPTKEMFILYTDEIGNSDSTSSYNDIPVDWVKIEINVD